jgi:tRNA (guanine37-N1)-methyltransferase
MEFDILTLFPRIFEGPLDESILKRAREAGLVQIRVHNLRDFTHDKHRVVDDKPYGGGPGMLMKPEPIFEAVEKLQRADSCVVLMTPQGAPFTQTRAKEFAGKAHLIIICGHYEGVDERVREAPSTKKPHRRRADHGALAAAVAVTLSRDCYRAIGQNRAADDSFATACSKARSTRPAEFRGMKSDALQSSNHGEVAGAAAQAGNARSNAARFARRRRQT